MVCGKLNQLKISQDEHNIKIKKWMMMLKRKKILFVLKHKKWRMEKLLKAENMANLGFLKVFILMQDSNNPSLQGYIQSEVHKPKHYSNFCKWYNFVSLWHKPKHAQHSKIMC